MMEFPEIFVKRGNVELHSGGTSDRLYDINSMFLNDVWREKIIAEVPENRHYVGIATCGALIGQLVAERRGATFSMINDGELVGPRPREGYLVIDDVTTTGNSIKSAMSILLNEDIGYSGADFYVVVDRRPLNQRDFDIGSMFDLGEKDGKFK